MSAFARASEAHDLIWMQLGPCAERLHRWLLRNRPVDCQQEIELEDFQEYTGEGRRRPYCMKHIKNALKALVEAGLVDIIKRYGGRVFKVIAKHPEGFDNEKKTSQSGKEISKIQLSNPHGYVPHNRDIQRTTNNVVVPEGITKGDNLTPSDEPPAPLNSDQEEAFEQPQANTPSDEQEGLLEEAREALKSMNPSLKKAILEASVSVVRNALEALHESQRVPSKVKNPAAWLMKAIQGEWKPNKPESQATSDFGEWMDWAQKAEIACASQRHPDRGIIILTSEDVWVPFEKMKQEWPIARLQERIELVTRPPAGPALTPPPVEQSEPQIDDTQEWLELALDRGIIAGWREREDGIWVEDPEVEKLRLIGPMRMKWPIARLKGD